MSISTYADLQDAVSIWLNKPDIEQSVPILISLAEADLNRRLRHMNMTRRSVAEISSQYSTVPSDYLETIRFSLTDAPTTALELISHSELLDRKSKAWNMSGRPAFHAVTGQQFEFYPVPSQTYSAELVYFSRLVSLSDESPVNWLLSDAPDVYLYGTLAHSAPFLGEDSRLQMWVSMYQSALDGLNTASDRARYSGTGLRMNIRGY